MAGSAGAELHPLLAATDFDAVFDKGAAEAAYSGFEGRDRAGTMLASFLAERGIERLEVCGIPTDYCVRATVLDACQLGFAVRVLVPLTAGVAGESTEEALSAMAEAGAELVGSLPAGSVLSHSIERLASEDR